ncbi:MBL fold metallo-hydrolase [Oleomonas cavernae]|uniref:Linear primary-alkylsulfatase n=1 Tax=Oleomonas cavernae TaxID=2320859 RepID=A0A418WB79_9PROT|nr:alkyl sulfatase dimerization domain-containing protein [Oleomonas cavernae]RJF87206.1 MBL fold metallo-hydrolase [Oleomonas cavernae]
MIGAFGLLAAAIGPALAEDPQGAKPASAYTLDANRQFLATLPLDDRQEIEFAQRGFIAAPEEKVVKTAEGKVVWDFTAYDFLKGDAPDTVNPSLWRHSQNMAHYGLFKVADHIYQVRGFDISNITFLEGKTGWIVIDPLISTEVAKAAYDLVSKHLGARPIHAVIITHSHADHYGGIRGIVAQADVDAGKVKVIAPEGFLEHAVSENVIAGNAMGRRASYMFGNFLPRNAQGQVSAGIGPALSAGTVTMIAPTDTITRTGQRMVIDGVTVEFQMTPGTEAPAEMNIFLPDWKALCLAENANASMHNVLTLRGALVRDAKAWADYLGEALRLYGDKTDVVFTSHFWPRWGQAEIVDYLEKHRDAYRYLHDQAVRLMNEGFTGEEIAEQIALPPVLANEWYNHGYYGTMRHNAKAVYQRYMGWYDGNPSSLNPLPPAEVAKRYVEAMGGADAVLAKGQAAFDSGDYRWAAELLKHLVFAGPDNAKARNLLADTYEQMAYQAESAPWRNIYLSGALELRTGQRHGAAAAGSLDTIKAMDSGLIFDLMAVRLDPAKADGKSLTVNLVFTDRDEKHTITVENNVLNHEAGAAATPGATLTGKRAAFLMVIAGMARLPDIVATGAIKVEGDAKAFETLVSLTTAPAPDFAIVTP